MKVGDLVKYNSPHGRSDILASNVGIIIACGSKHPSRDAPIRPMSVLWTNGKKGSYPHKYLEVIG